MNIELLFTLVVDETIVDRIVNLSIATNSDVVHCICPKYFTPVVKVKGITLYEGESLGRKGNEYFKVIDSTTDKETLSLL